MDDPEKDVLEVTEIHRAAFFLYRNWIWNSWLCSFSALCPADSDITGNIHIFGNHLYAFN